MSQDAEQLKLLSIFHYVVGGLMTLFALFPLIYVGLGLFFILGPHKFADRGGEAPPAIVGWFFVIIFGFVFLFGETIAILIITTGRYLAQRSHYSFCQVIACIECLFMPFGTVLGIFTIILLLRDSVKPLFKGQSTTP